MVDPMGTAVDLLVPRRRTEIRLERLSVLPEVVPRPGKSRPVFRRERRGEPGGEVARCGEVVIEGMETPSLAIANQVCECLRPIRRRVSLRPIRGR